MTREQAIELARIHAKAQPQSYYSEPFQPHEWVIAAILAASLPAVHAPVQTPEQIAHMVETAPALTPEPAKSPMQSLIDIAPRTDSGPRGTGSWDTIA